MSVIPLTTTGPGPTVVSPRDAFAAAEGFNGNAAYICNMDPTQLRPEDKESHLSYDLRIGHEYKDHRDQNKQELANDGEIVLLPGVAVILVTEEMVCLPRTMFGYIVPRVSLLQKGVSNTLSKVDPGYDGPLVITIFNLGKRTVKLKRREAFCSLVLHTVVGNTRLYSKPAQAIAGEPRKRRMQRLIDWIQAHAGEVATLALLAQLLPLLRSGALLLVKSLIETLSKFVR